MRSGFALALLLAIGCGPTLRQARLTDAEPPSERELAAAERIEHRRCNPAWKWLLPGMGDICLRRAAEGTATLGIFFAEIGGAVAADRAGSSAQAPLVAVQDLYLYGIARPVLDEHLALRLRYVPSETTAELLGAPWNVHVLVRADVWLGTVLFAGLAFGLEAAIGELPRNHFGADPVLFGQRLDPAVGYPLGALTLGATVEHVALAEESLFRGLLQSGLARHCGEGCGHLWASLLFGAAHATNALELSNPGERRRYLEFGLPFITLGGTYMGWVYRRSGYALSTSVAIHFWYDFLLSLGDFLIEPQTSSLVGRVTIPF